MCYLTIFSTSSDADLACTNSPQVQFSRAMPAIPEEKYLQYQNKWYLGSESGCSCDFRHLCFGSASLGFGEPEDWFPEEASHIEASRQVIATIRSLVEKGAQVDCFDAWAHGQTDADTLLGEVEVNLATVSDLTFRFFENFRFNFSQHPTPSQ